MDDSVRLGRSRTKNPKFVMNATAGATSNALTTRPREPDTDLKLLSLGQVIIPREYESTRDLNLGNLSIL